jgi:hypothetical protein
MEESWTTLSDDVVGEILQRINDVATLFRCAATCKSWRRRIANPCFLLRRQWPPSPVVGFFTKRRPGTETSPTDSSSSQLAFVPLPGPSLLGKRPRALNSFICSDDAAVAAVADGATPLAKRGGLLLVRLHSIDDDLNRKTFSFPPVFNPVVRLAVCNLFAGTWDVLPELNCQTRFRPGNRYGCDIIPSVAGDGSPAFKVLMIGEDKDEFNLHTFVSGEASWRAPTKCFDMMEGRMLSMENTGGAVVCGGYAHWLFASGSNHFHVLNVDVETGHVSLTKLLNPTRDIDGLFCQVDLDDYDAAMAHNQRVLHDLTDANRLVTTSNGIGLSLCTYRGRRLEIWTRHQDDGHERGDGEADWRHTAGETDHKLTELIQQLERPSCIWTGERSGTMLIRECPGERVFIAHLDTGTLEEAMDQPRNGIMPVEIDWPTYFMLRLGGSV